MTQGFLLFSSLCGSDVAGIFCEGIRLAVVAQRTDGFLPGAASQEPVSWRLHKSIGPVTADSACHSFPLATRDFSSFLLPHLAEVKQLLKLFFPVMRDAVVFPPDQRCSLQMTNKNLSLWGQRVTRSGVPQDRSCHCYSFYFNHFGVSYRTSGGSVFNFILCNNCLPHLTITRVSHAFQALFSVIPLHCLQESHNTPRDGHNY